MTNLAILRAWHAEICALLRRATHPPAGVYSREELDAMLGDLMAVYSLAYQEGIVL